ncbi:MAG: hypothetical protein WAR79_10155 [Melioribacteraceae bacterium]
MFKIRLIVLSFFLFITNYFAQNEFNNFIKRDGYLLKDGDSVFRFLSFNIPNINYVEDEMEFTKTNPFRLPTTFEIRDAFESIKQLGGTVVRSYTFPVKREDDSLQIPCYVLSPGEFDENSFLVMDSVLTLSNEIGIRLIVPLLNNWKWMGGVPQYAEFRGKSEWEFWTDSILINDFKKTINYVLNRVNTVTGIQYKDDKSILCWETGNELYSPYSWTKEIVTYIKSIDKNHLVMDGFNAIDGTDIHQESLSDTLIDIVTTHHYELNPIKIIDDIKSQIELNNKRKVYVIGEYGFLGTSAIEQISNFIIENKEIAGGLIWSLRSHRKEGGFYWHSEPLGGDIFKAFHYPGFTSGLQYNEENFLKMFRKKAFEIRNEILPKIEKPNSPKLLAINKNSKISWQGSIGAKFYDVERSESIDGIWETVGYNISDAEQYYTSLFNDNNAEIGKNYFYRIIAKNLSGNSEPSNVVGPITCNSRMLIDYMQNLTVLYFAEGDLELKTNEARKFKEDSHRLEISDDSKLVYFVDGKIISFNVFAFSKDDEDSLIFSLSNNGDNFEEVKVNRKSYYSGEGDYDYWIPAKYSLEIYDSKDSNSFIQFEANQINQISQIEIEFIPNK